MRPLPYTAPVPAVARPRAIRHVVGARCRRDGRPAARERAAAAGGLTSGRRGSVTGAELGDGRREAGARPAAGRGSRGFTMVELLAVVAIVALLAAVVLPQVASERTSAGPAALGSELRNIQTATEMFQVHTRTATPGELVHLSHRISGGDLDVWGAPYSGQETAGWDGPYIDASLRPGLPADTAAGIEAAFGADFCNDLFVVDSGQMDYLWAHPSVIGSDTTCADFGNLVEGDFVAVAVTSLTHQQWARVDDRVDGGDGENVGRVRWANSGGLAPENRGRLVYLLTTLQR